MKKVHLLFIENSNGQKMEDLRKHLPFNKMYINKNDKRYILYAVTDDKNLRDKFLTERSRSFISIKQDFEELPKKLQDGINEFMLKYNKYYDGTKKRKILGPSYEYYTVRHYWDNLIEPEEYFNAMDIPSLSVLDEDYLVALYRVGFIQLFLLSTGTEDSDWYTAAEQDVETGHYVFVENEFPFIHGSKSKDPEYLEIGANEFNLFMHWYKYSFDLNEK